MNNSKLQPLLRKYEGNRIIRGLIQLVPFGFGGAIDVVLVKTLENIREERTRAFFDELANGNVLLDESLLESEDFLHCYFATVKLALNSRRREKIRMFARFLKSSLTGEGPHNVDEYEDFLWILDELSYLELQALAIMDGFSDRPRTQKQNDLQWVCTFWDEFVKQLEDELEISPDEANDFMNRISRTGCYQMFTAGYFYPGGKGKLTPIYRRLKKSILESSHEG